MDGSKPKQSFGGSWTEQKLTILRKYLVAYTTALKNQPFKLVYIDAFAGTGYREIKAKDPETQEQEHLFFPEFVETEFTRFTEGSAKIALAVVPPFHHYIFIEKSKKRCAELERLKKEYQSISEIIDIRNEDANQCLIKLCKTYDWTTKRAVLFLDPFGMQVEWRTIEAVAQTRAIDMWYLFPMGVAVNRLLRRDGNIPAPLKKRLTVCLGTEEWYKAFYAPKQDITLFGISTGVNKTGDYSAIANFLLERLGSVFSGVAKNPRLLYNSRGVPLYLLCFAAANPKGAKVALKIAQHILGKSGW